MMAIDFSDRTYLVTGGAGTGIGAGVCEAIAACGGSLLINDIDGDKITEAVERYPKAHALIGDVSKEKDVQRMFSEAKEKFGPIHGLVNNAGIGLRKKAHLATEQEFDTLFGIDVRGVWLMAKAFAQQLIHSENVGHIVNISSVHAHKTTATYAIYASAKAAVEALTKGMSVELGALGIRCNAVAPGYVDSEQNEEAIASWTQDAPSWIEAQKRDYQSIPNEISSRDCGNAVVFLLSDLSTSITGQTLVVDAGFTNLLYANSFIPDK